MDEQKKPKTDTPLKFLPLILFCAVIFAVFILYIILPKETYSSQEKRVLADMPEFSAETLLSGDFGEDFEDYLTDHMPLRTLFVGMNAYYDLYSGRNGSNGVYKCSDGYLIAESVEYTENMDKNVSYIDEFAQTVGVPTYMCIVPSAGYIMSDKLPANHHEYTDNDIIAKACEDLSAGTAGIEYIDITEDFLELSGSVQLYYKTDHHWTSRGAYECYTVLAGTMGFTPTPESSFSIESYDGFYGTSYSKAALWNTPSETLELWRNTSRAAGSVTVTITENGKSFVSDDMYFTENLETDDMYTAYLDGNHGYVTIENTAAELDETLLVIRDSYTHCLAPFLADNYSKVILIDVRYYKETVSALAQEEGVDVILALYSVDSIVNSTDIAYLY